MGDMSVDALIARMGLTPVGDRPVPGLSGIQDLGDKVANVRRDPRFEGLAARRMRDEITPEEFIGELEKLIAA